MSERQNDDGGTSANPGKGDWTDVIGRRIRGRIVAVRFGEVEASGQFLVSLSVDGEVRWEGHITDKSHDA